MIPPENFAWTAHAPEFSWKNDSKPDLENAARPLLALALCLALATGACVSSTEPILSDARAILGERGQLHIFSAPKDGARNVLRYDFQWRRDRYVTTPGRRAGSRSNSPPTPSRAATWWCSGRAPWPGRRSRSSAGCRPVTYFLLRKVAEGAFLMLPVTEDDVDDATRKRFCIKSPEATCRISTPEQLFVFARAAAEKEDPDAGIVVVLAAPAKR